MSTDTTALLVSILLMVLIAAWVPFLDFCSGCVRRRRQRRAAAEVMAFPVGAESSHARKVERIHRAGLSLRDRP